MKPPKAMIGSMREWFDDSEKRAKEAAKQKRKRAAQRLAVFEVFIGSRQDRKLRDRIVIGGSEGTAVYKLPIRGRYIIECKGPVTAEKKALALAAADGIGGAISKGYRRLGIKGQPGADDIFNELMGLDE